MKTKSVSGAMLTLLLIGVLTMVSNISPVKAQPFVRVYIYQPLGYIPGVDPGPFQVDIYIETSGIADNSSNGIVGWALDIQVDPNVIDLSYAYAYGAQRNYTLWQFARNYTYPAPTLLQGGLEPTTGYWDDLAEMIMPTPPGGAGDTTTASYPKLVTLEFDALSKTAYSKIDLIDVEYLTTDGLWHAADEVIDGHYNQPPPYHTLTVESTPIDGINFTIDTTTYTTDCSVGLPEGNYTVTMPSTWMVGSDQYSFSHWEDNSTNAVRAISLTSNMTITAAYKLELVPPATIALISDYSELLAIAPILDSMGIGYDIYNDNSIHLHTENLSLLLDYSAVIFYTDYRHITSNEYSALESYLSSGGNLLVTGYDCLAGDSLLADLVRSSSYGDNVGEPDLYVVDATHPMMNGPYGSFSAGYHISGLYSDCDAAEADTARNALTVAELADGYDKIIATEGLPGKVVFWNGVGPNDWTWNADCEAMFKNTLAWFTIRHEHELTVSLEAPDFLQPGQSCLLNATVQNRGLNNETNVDLFLLVDGTTVGNATISELPTEASYTINYGWTPMAEATYNVTAYATPVPGENVTANNMMSKIVEVRYLPKLLVVDTPSPEDTGSLDILGYEYILVTPTEFATVDLYQYNVLFIGWIPGDTLVDALLARASEIADWVAAGNGIVALAEFEEVNRWAWLPLWVDGSDGYHADMVHILDPAHPVMSGLTDAELSGWGNSYHGYFASYDSAWEALAEGVEAAEPITLAATYGAGGITITDQDPDYHLYYGMEEGAGELLRNMIEWVTTYIRYEHELTVTLDAPNFLEPGDSSLLNATVYNRGLSNETNVELFLLIDGTQVSHATIPEVVSGASYTIDYLWTPTVEATYNVTAYALPVLGENITTNNWRTEFVGVFAIVKAVVLDSWGTDYGHYAFWDYLNTNWATYGSIPIVIDYTSLNKENITLTDIAATQADVLIISDAWDYGGGWEFTDSEIEAIRTYVLSGHGIIATSGTFNTMDGMAPNNRKLADLFGMDPDIEYRWAIETSGTFDLLTPRHDELWRNIPDPYLSDFTITIYPYPSADWTSQGVTTGWIEALSTDHYGAVITNEVYRAVYFTCMIECYGQHNENNRQLFYNAIVWAQLPPYEHDLAVSIEVPAFLEPGDSSLLNATVYNIGLSNETSVELQLLINGTVVDSVVISELESRSSYTLSYLWTPILEGIYNVTGYALPVPDENITTNNVYSAFVTVRFKPRILAYVQYADYWQEYANSLAAIDSTFGPAYVLTELWDYTQLDSMLPGNDVLFIPEQEYSYLSMMETIGEAWSESLSNFVEEGGVIILCDYNWGDGGTYGILTGAGLMSISSVNYRSGWTVYLVDPTDPLAIGVSSSFTAPYGALSFVTDETNVVFDDGTYPVVIHKKVGQGHIALIGFDYSESNPDTEQILGNAVSLAIYMRISISPSAGSPGTEVTVTGTKAAANGVVEIYWDDTLIGDTTADAVGNFTYLLTVPLDAIAGLHEIRAVDVATGETSSRTFRVIFITVNPVSGPIGTKVTVNGAGFSAYTQVPITFDDMQIGYALTDDVGNFKFVFNIPLSEAGLHSVKAWSDLNLVETSFTVVDVTPLEIQMDVGALFFKGETAEFYVQTCFNGMPVNATSINVTLCKPDGTVEALVAERIARGLYKTECLIKGKGSMVGTYMLVVEGSFTTSTVDANGTCIKTFLVKEPYTTLEKEAPKAALVVGSIGTILALVITWRKRKHFKE